MCPSPEQPIINLIDIVIIVGVLVLCYLAWRVVSSKGGDDK